MTLSKSESRRRWRELREIVNRWDPVGGLSGASEWPEDEYECVVGPLLRMLEAGESQEKLKSYLETEVRQHFGLEPMPGAAEKCVAEALAWYERGWRDQQI